MMLAGGVLWAHPKVTNPNTHDIPVGKTAFFWSFPYVCPEPVLAK
jgi:hypothetical protein